jgi:hypothetical protein
MPNAKPKRKTTRAKAGYKLIVLVLCAGEDQSKWKCFRKEFILPFPPYNGLTLYVGKFEGTYVDQTLKGLSYDPESGEFEVLLQEPEEEWDLYRDMGFKEEKVRHGGQRPRRHLKLVPPPEEG